MYSRKGIRNGTLIALVACALSAGVLIALGVLHKQRTNLVVAIEPSRGMEPTLRRGERLIMDLSAYRERTPDRGEVVVAKVGNDPPRMLAKRVVAVANDTICIHAGVVYLNRQPVLEHYVLEGHNKLAMSQEFPEVKVGVGSVFLLGDWRDQSEDSRQWGPVPESQIVGKVVAN